MTKLRVSVVFILSLSSCASLTGAGDLSVLDDSQEAGWEVDPKRRRRAPHKKRKLIDKHQTLQTLVKQSSSPEECYRKAESNSTANLESSWALVRACIDYRGFDKLEAVLEEPWIQIHRQNWSKSAELVTQLVAMRGGNVKLDVGICTRLGFELRELDDVLRDPEGEKNTLTMFRAKLTSFRRKANDLKLVLRTETHDVSAKIPSSKITAKASQEYVFLGVFRRVSEAKNAGRFNDEIVHIDLRAAYPMESPADN